MKILDILIKDPASISNDLGLRLWDEFFLKVYSDLYVLIDPNATQFPHIDYYIFKPKLTKILSMLNDEQISILRNMGSKSIVKSEWNKSPETRSIMVFLWNFPMFSNLFLNIHLLADVVIKSTEFHLTKKIDNSNFIQAKQFIDGINRQRWPGRQSKEEEQSGTSNLGGVSELLLAKAFGDLVDGRNLLRVSNQKIQSYGDFVLMCLPNNLFLSVKSNFARERLLASGYTTDILGAGFFTSKKEFISRSKIRNFQRVGFLAMYLPDLPISEDQVNKNKNTYNEVLDEYASKGMELPLNINGTCFFRRLSQLHGDVSKMLEEKDVQKRTTIDF